MVTGYAYFDTVIAAARFACMKLHKVRKWARGLLVRDFLICCVFGGGRGVGCFLIQILSSCPVSVSKCVNFAFELEDGRKPPTSLLGYSGDGDRAARSAPYCCRAVLGAGRGWMF